MTASMPGSSVPTRLRGKSFILPPQPGAALGAAAADAHSQCQLLTVPGKVQGRLCLER